MGFAATARLPRRDETVFSGDMRGIIPRRVLQSVFRGDMRGTKNTARAACVQAYGLCAKRSENSKKSLDFFENQPVGRVTVITPEI